MTDAVAGLAADLDRPQSEGLDDRASFPAGTKTNFSVSISTTALAGTVRTCSLAELSSMIRTNIPSLSRSSGLSVWARSGTVRVWGSTTAPTERSRAENSRSG